METAWECGLHEKYCLAKEMICAKQEQVVVVVASHEEEEAELGWSHLILPPTLDSSSQVYLSLVVP